MLTLIKTRKCSIKYQCVLNKRKFAIVLIPWTLFICTWGKCYLLMNCVYFIKKCYTQNNSAFLFFLISSNFMIRYGINNIFHQFRMIMQISLAPKTCSISYTGMVLIFKKGSRTNNLIYVVFKMIKVCLVQKKYRYDVLYVKSELVKMPIDSKWQKWYQNSSNIVFLYF